MRGSKTVSYGFDYGPDRFDNHHKYCMYYINNSGNIRSKPYDSFEEVADAAIAFADKVYNSNDFDNDKKKSILKSLQVLDINEMSGVSTPELTKALLDYANRLK